MSESNMPILYKRSKDGKIHIWKTWRSKNVFYTEHGIDNGKKQLDTRLIKKGKNLDKSNWTTAEEQAQLEMESKWKQQVDKGYKESLNSIDDLLIRPMLAMNYNDRKKHMTFPCVAQRKYDGVRCLSSVKDDKIELTSRNGKPFPHLEHLHEEIKKFINNENIVIDGELYSSELSFQELVGLVKKEKITEEDKKKSLLIGYRIYDAIFLDDLQMQFKNRTSIIKGRFNDTYTYLQRVENDMVMNESGIKPLHDKYVQEGYEGIILRALDGVYGLNKRSNDLQKFKEFIDREYKIIDFEEGEGRAAGSVVWICATDPGRVFKVRPRGTDAERRNWFKNGKKYINQLLTVRYQELTDEGTPRFPVGISIRNYE